MLIDKILEFNETYKQKKMEKLAEKRVSKSKKKKKVGGDYGEDMDS